MRMLTISFLLVSILLWSRCNHDKSIQENTTTITSRLPAEPDILNPLLTTNGYSRQIANQIFSYLVHYDPATLKITPMLAKALPKINNISEGQFKGGQSISFKIHSNAIWNNGSSVTGHDVLFSLKTILNPKVNANRLRPFFEKIKKVEIDKNDSKKISIYFGNRSFLIQELFTNLPILPAYHYDPNGIMTNFPLENLTDLDRLKVLPEQEAVLQKFADTFHSTKFTREPEGLNGSGPYQLTQWTSGQYIVLEKKENWWGDNVSAEYPLLKAIPKKIIYKIIPDATTAITNLKSGEIDIMNGFSPKNFKELKANDFANSMLDFYSTPAMIYYYILINKKNKKLSDKKVRRALAHVLDIDEIINITMYGFAKRIVGPISSSKSYYNDNLKLIDFNLEKAKQLLTEAGWKDSDNNGIVDKLIDGKKTEMELDYLINSGGTGETIGELLKDHAKKVGIKINIVVKEFVTKMNHIKKRDFEMALMASGFDYALDELKQMWHTTSDTPQGGNRSGFGNAQSDRIIENIETSTNEKERAELYQQFQSLVYDDQPYIFLFSIQQNIAINKKWKGNVFPKRPGVFENLMEPILDH